jgi:abortive infection bacteriophage resistance protein
MVLKYLYYSQEKWDSSFVVRLEALLSEYEEHIELKHLGFPENWLELLKESYPYKIDEPAH